MAERDPKYERWRWQIFSITWLAYAGYDLTRKAFSVAKNELKKPAVMGLSTEQMSYIDGWYSAAYAVGQLFWGTGGDRLGPRRVVAVPRQIARSGRGCPSSFAATNRE